MGRWGLLLWVTCLACAATQAGGETRDRFEVGGWEGYAVTDEGGLYRYCAAGELPSDGTNMILYWRDSGFSLSLYNDLWQLPEDASYTVSAAIDRRWSRNITGEAYSATAISFDFGHDAYTVRAFRLGNRLTISTGEATLRFDLKGTNAAIDALKACHERNRSAEPGGGSSLATAGPAGPPETVTGSDYRKVERPHITLEELRSLMTENISVRIKVVPTPDGLSHYDFHAPASAGYIRGSYVELNPGTSSSAEIMTDHLAVSQLLCTGVFASGSEPAVAFGTSTVQRAFAACDSSDITLHEQFTIFLTTAGFAQLYIITSDDEGRETAAMIANELFDTLEAFAYYLTLPE